MVFEPVVASDTVPRRSGIGTWSSEFKPTLASGDKQDACDDSDDEDNKTADSSKENCNDAAMIMEYKLGVQGTMSQWGLDDSFTSRRIGKNASVAMNGPSMNFLIITTSCRSAIRLLKGGKSSEGLLGEESCMVCLAHIQKGEMSKYQRVL
jgi:hypothetical protein